MGSLSFVASANNNSKKNSNGRLEDVVRRISALVSEELSKASGFEEYEKTLLEICNEVGRQVLQAKLEEISRQFEAEYLLVGGLRYRQHTQGTVEYHSLCGSMKIERYTYRQTAVRNGPTIVPLDIAAGLMEKATPALAYRAALGDAQCPGRQWEEQLRASHRRPPSRSTLERMAKKIGESIERKAPEILPIVRREETIDSDVVALSIGLDRTTIPMEEKLRKGDIRDPELRRRKKPYVRRAPEPVEVKYRMGYVGTVSLMDTDGESIKTLKYGCPADVDPKHILKMMTDDLAHIQGRRKESGLPSLPMGIIQDGAPEMWNLVEQAVNKALSGSRFQKGIDRFHLMERLAESINALRDPLMNGKGTLDDWRRSLESDDNAIDKIEAFLQTSAARLRRQKKLSAANAEILRSHLTYIKNNKKYMRYASLRKRGIPTGIGATEGACKSLIMIRAKGCGQRWHSRGVNSVLTLRGLYLSERLELFWSNMNKQRKPAFQMAA